MEYNFSLKYQLAEPNMDMDALVERLGEVGCDDALVGIGQPGRIALEFIRESRSAEAALTSALADVKAAIPDARLIEVAPDLVGLTEVADVIGVTRQNMRKLMIGNPGDFPTPVHEGSTSIWHLAEILIWLQERGNYAIDESTLAVAQAGMQINLTKELHTRPMRPTLSKEVRTLVA